MLVLGLRNDAEDFRIEARKPTFNPASASQGIVSLGRYSSHDLNSRHSTARGFHCQVRDRVVAFRVNDNAACQPDARHRARFRDGIAAYREGAVSAAESVCEAKSHREAKNFTQEGFADRIQMH